MRVSTDSIAALSRVIIVIGSDPLKRTLYLASPYAQLGLRKPEPALP
jgi:hypothetical protein